MENGLQHYGLNGSLNGGLNKAFSETRVGRFFGRLVGRIRRNPWLNTVTLGFADKFASLLEGASAGLDAIGIEFRYEWVDVTYDEGIILDNWDNTQFSPFVENIIRKLQPYYDNGQPVTLELVNEVLIKIFAVESYCLLPISKTGLSDNASNQRNIYVKETLEILKEQVTKLLEKQNLSVGGILSLKVDSKNVEALNVKFASPFTFVAIVYKPTRQLPTTEVQDIEDSLPYNTGVVNPTTPIVLPETLEDVIVTDGQPTGTTETKKSGYGWLWWVGAGLLARKLLK